MNTFHELCQRYVKQEQILILTSKGRLCWLRTIQVVFKRPLAIVILKRRMLLYQTNVPGFHEMVAVQPQVAVLFITIYFLCYIYQQQYYIVMSS